MDNFKDIPVLKSTRINFDKLDRLRQQRWHQYANYTYRCNKHDTFFCLDKEPCWQCYSECEEII